jgi:hypothetical protein
MKTKLRFLGLALTVCGLAFVASCSKDDDGNDDGNGDVQLAAPANLAVSNVTRNTADFAWAAVEGASSYELQWGRTELNEPVELTATSYTVESLLPGSDYQWQVRAKSAETFSAWATGATFTTEANPAPTVGAVIKFGDEPQWTAGYAYVEIDDEYGDLWVDLYKHDPSDWASTEDYEYPFLNFFVPAEVGVTDIAESIDELWYYFDVNYYHQTYTVLSDYAFGDYYLDYGSEGTIEITAIDDEKVSGHVDVTVLDVVTADAGGAENYVDLEITFFNLPFAEGNNVVPLGASAGVPGSVKASAGALKPGKHPIKFGRKTGELIQSLKKK